MEEKMGDSRKRKLDRVDFLSDHVFALKKAIHADVIVNPGDNGPGIPSHRALLAVRSQVFRSMLEFDECKDSQEKSITIPDLSYEELYSLLEFFYTGTLTSDNKHIRALYLAADKYDIQYLQDLCRQLFVSSLNTNNVFDILQFSTIHSDKILKEAAITFVTINMHILFTQSFESFVHKNPTLSLEITRACINTFRPYVNFYRLHNRPK